jgi:hypothetical protein
MAHRGALQRKQNHPTGRLQNGCSASFLVEGGFDSHAPPPPVSELAFDTDVLLLAVAVPWLGHPSPPRMVSGPTSRGARGTPIPTTTGCCGARACGCTDCCSGKTRRVSPRRTGIGSSTRTASRPTVRRRPGSASDVELRAYLQLLGEAPARGGGDGAYGIARTYWENVRARLISGFCHDSEEYGQLRRQLTPPCNSCRSPTCAPTTTSRYGQGANQSNCMIDGQ